MPLTLRNICSRIGRLDAASSRSSARMMVGADRPRRSVAKALQRDLSWSALSPRSVTFLFVSDEITAPSCFAASFARLMPSAPPVNSGSSSAPERPNRSTSALVRSASEPSSEMRCAARRNSSSGFIALTVSREMPSCVNAAAALLLPLPASAIPRLNFTKALESVPNSTSACFAAYWSAESSSTVIPVLFAVLASASFSSMVEVTNERSAAMPALAPTVRPRAPAMPLSDPVRDVACFWRPCRSR